MIAALAFDYTNWRGDPHRYVIAPEPQLVLGPYERGGANDGGDPEWVISGQLITRDGDGRPDLEPNARKRTFLLKKMSNMETIPLKVAGGA